MAASDKRKDFMAEDYEPVNIDKWDGNAVKNALDDNIKNILKKEYNYAEDFSLVDQRLLICTIACCLSLFAVAYDYLYPFPQSKIVLATCSISYFVFSGLLTLFSTYRERNIFMCGVQRGLAGLGPNDYLYISSLLPKYGHMYKLGFRFVNGKTKTETNKTTEKSITEWIDNDGNLVMERLFNDINQLHNQVVKPDKQD